MVDPKDPVAEDSLMLCCGGKRCPVIKQNTSSFELSDDFGQTIKLSREQAALLAQWIGEKTRQ